jgi:hypothetical protein
MTTTESDAALKKWMASVIEKLSLPIGNATVEYFIAEAVRENPNWRMDGESAGDFRRTIERLLSSILGDKSTDAVTGSTQLREDAKRGTVKLSLTAAEIKKLA